MFRIISFSSIPLSSWYIFIQARTSPPANLCIKELPFCLSPAFRSWSCLYSNRLPSCTVLLSVLPACIEGTRLNPETKSNSRASSSCWGCKANRRRR
jgi:hypothetical protein